MPRTAFALSDADVDGQVASLAFLYNEFGGASNWTSAARVSWQTNVLPLNRSTFQTSSCIQNGGELALGIRCASGRIVSVIVSAFGLQGPANRLTYSTFFRFFPDVQFDFGLNGLTGPLANDFGAPMPQSLSFILNQLSGPIPPSLFGPGLQRLDVSDNAQLEGAVPAAIVNATDLRELYVRSLKPDSTTTLPDGICTLAQLQALDLSKNSYRMLPWCFNETSSNTTLAASRSPAPLHASLLRLYLNHNQLGGPVPPTLCYFTELRDLHLTSNAFTGAFPTCLARLTRLEQLDVLATKMTGSFPNFIFTSMPNLQILQIGGFSGPVADRLSSEWLPDLFKLTLAGPTLPATFPNETLTGPFPMSVFGASKLTVLTVQGSWFTGKLWSVNFTTVRRISEVNFQENPLLAGEFPTHLLTDVWTQPIVPGQNQFARYINIDGCPLFTGALPDLSATQIAALRDLNTGAVFAFRNSGFYGWIPDSMASWVPASSQPNLLQNCTQLFYPVQNRFLSWTAQYRGAPTSIGSTSGNPSGNTSVAAAAFSAAAAQSNGTLIVNGSFPQSAFYQVAIFDKQTTSQAAVLEAYKSAGAAAAWAKRRFNVSASARLSDGSIGGASGSQRAAQLYVSRLPDLELTSIPRFFALVFLVGPFRGIATPESDSIVLVSEAVVNIPVYHPTPTVEGFANGNNKARRQGCVSLTIAGVGFFNAPSPAIKILSRVALGHTADRDLVISGADNVRVNTDIAITFTLPFANEADPNQVFDAAFAAGQSYPVEVYPAGLDLPWERSRSTSSAASIRFVATCDAAPLTDCTFGHTDPFGCPSRPMCSCESRGVCVAAADDDATPPTCGCDMNFAGASCGECTAGHHGPSCLSCGCVHGACDARRDGDGACTCSAGWGGQMCTVNKAAVGVGIGLPVAAFVAGLVAFIFVRHRRRERRRRREELAAQRPPHFESHLPPASESQQSAIIPQQSRSFWNRSDDEAAAHAAFGHQSIDLVPKNPVHGLHQNEPTDFFRADDDKPSPTKTARASGSSGGGGGGDTNDDTRSDQAWEERTLPVRSPARAAANDSHDGSPDPSAARIDGPPRPPMANEPTRTTSPSAARSPNEPLTDGTTATAAAAAAGARRPSLPSAPTTAAAGASPARGRADSTTTTTTKRTGGGEDVPKPRAGSALAPPRVLPFTITKSVVGGPVRQAPRRTGSGSRKSSRGGTPTENTPAAATPTHPPLRTAQQPHFRDAFDESTLPVRRPDDPVPAPPAS